MSSFDRAGEDVGGVVAIGHDARVAMIAAARRVK